MLAVTERAASAIHALTDPPQVPEGTGLRIATGAQAGSLQLSLATAPADGDQVLSSGDALLFLDAAAAMMLDEKLIDATMSEGGEIEFILSDQ
jgi:iron-sulfur cluster assembly protein